MTNSVQPDYDKLLAPITEITTSVEALLEGAFGSLMGDQREGLKRVYSSAWGLHTLFMDVITSLGIENIARRAYLEDKFIKVVDPMISNCRELLDAVDGPLEEEQTACVDYLLETGLLLRRYIDMLWLYSRILHKKMPVRAGTFRLQEAMETLDLPLKPDTISLDVLLSDDLVAVRGDIHATQIAMQQVIRNALQYTQQGHIKITTQAKSAQVMLLVEDSGCGIAAPHQARIFEPFFQTSPTNDGIGLGLCIARRLMEGQGGQVTLLQSSSGDGSIFALSLPTA